MNATIERKRPDVPLPVALAMFAAVAALFIMLKIGTRGMDLLQVWLTANDEALLWSGAAALVNAGFLTVIGMCLFGVPKPGSHVRTLIGEKADRAPIPYRRLLVALAVACLASIVEHARGSGSPIWVTDVPLDFIDMDNIRTLLSANFAVAVYALSFWLSKSGASALLRFGRRDHDMAPFPILSDGIVLGADENQPKRPAWVSMDRKALNGNILITGGIGSGKTQGAILPYLDQILGNFRPSPAILAIDPKGVFVKKALKIAEKHGLLDQCLHIRLGGSVRYNPIYHPKVLQGARAVEIAHMLKAAAVNSGGRGAGDAFWEVSAFNLVKNAIVYCGAVFGYYTLNDLYGVLVKAGKTDLVEDLQRVLGEARFCAEERFNVEQAITYFDAEFTQFEDRVRTGILASATAFLNQFNDYQASRIFCPKEDEVTFRSIDEAIDSGKIILFDVDNPSLARSLGTVLKIQFQSSILSRLSDDARKTGRAGVLIIDEYQDVVTSGRGVALGDESFLAKGREADAITIVATQSLTSLENALGGSKAAHELFQNFRTRLAGSTTDLATIRAFQEIAGHVEREHRSHSVSETSQDAKANVLLGGYEAGRSTNLTEGVTTSTRKEYLIASEDFARLTMFESFAQVFDGGSTTFRRLCLKPHFAQNKAQRHAEILELVKKGVAAAAIASVALQGAGNASAAPSMPNVCNVVNSPYFDACSEVEISSCTCPGIPPRPCAWISYYRPETFIEVMPNAGETFFAGLPIAKSQLAGVKAQSLVPYGAAGEVDNHAFETHVLDVPWASLIGNFLPCGGQASERTCFDAMSEHLGDLWTNGTADLKQPAFLAWAAAPKQCIMAGAAQSVAGGMADPGASQASGMCSIRMDALRQFPPSTHAACTGWGLFFPRVGVYEGPSQAAAALMVAARMKSLGAEVFQSVTKSPDEKWEMTIPQASMCFREGQNVGLLETAGQVQEFGRLGGAPLKGYLFTIWRKVGCCRDFPEAAALRGELAALKASCAGKGGSL